MININIASNFLRMSKDKQPRVNKAITVKEVRLINELDEMIGVVSIHDALKMADDAGLDLVEISPTATPPVCKITELGKYIYDKQKKSKNSKNAKKMKEIKFKTVIGRHDFEIKINHIVEFLKEKYPVKLSVDMVNRQVDKDKIAKALMTDALAIINAAVKCNSTVPKAAGRSIQCMFSPM